MSRRRMINANIWEDEKFNQLDFTCRLLFIGIITQSDDYGKLRGNPKLLKSKIFPYDNCEITTEKYLNQLNDLGMIQLYEVNNEKFIKINNWTKHQTLTYKGINSIPEPTLNQPLTNPEPTHNSSIVKYSIVKSSKDKLSKTLLVPNPKVLELVELLKSLIISNYPKTKPLSNSVHNQWLQDADRLLRIDKRDFEEAKELIKWCQQDDFWHSNILSMAKFRKQWQQLYLKRNVVNKKPEKITGGAGYQKNKYL